MGVVRIKKDLEQIKETLLLKKQELEEKLTELSREKFTDDQVQDPGDQALSSTMEALRTSLQDTEINEYNKLIKALEKVDDGSYGICADCGQEIAEKRLLSYPDASRCLACQEAFEDSERIG